MEMFFFMEYLNRLGKKIFEKNLVGSMLKKILCSSGFIVNEKVIN